MCTVVQYLTHDFIRLVNLLKSCNGMVLIFDMFVGSDPLVIIVRLQQTIKRPLTADPSPNEVRALVILIFIVSLLAENFDFDNLRKDKPGTSVELGILADC